MPSNKGFSKIFTPPLKNLDKYIKICYNVSMRMRSDTVSILSSVPQKGHIMGFSSYDRGHKAFEDGLVLCKGCEECPADAQSVSPEDLDNPEFLDGYFANGEELGVFRAPRRPGFVRSPFRYR